MKKKLNFIISFILILMIAVGSFAVPVASYENDVITSSVAMLLINLDTDTVCYSANSDKKWYASYLSEMMTFIIAVENVDDPSQVKADVTRDFIYSLPYSDGSLDIFIGKKLTLKDLLAIMMLTPGSDAAYLIADTVCEGDIELFVSKMNDKVAALKCNLTHFITPGYSESNQQYTCCDDIYLMFKELSESKLYHELIANSTYTPPGLEDNARTYEVTTENSILNPVSPYYFRYTTGGKYSFDVTAMANIFVTTRYKGKSYFFAALRGKNKSEQNVFADARRMTTWAYLNLSDRKVVDTEDAISTYKITAAWGEYEADLFAKNAAFKTLPKQYEESKLSYKVDIPETIKLPIFEGQTIGTAMIYYGNDPVDDVSLISGSDEGVDVLTDLAHFGMNAVSEILINEPPTEPPTKLPALGSSAATSAPESIPEV